MSLLKYNAQPEPKYGDFGTGAFLGDIATSNAKDLTSGFYIQKKDDKGLTYTYTYKEQKIVISGTLEVKNLETGEAFTAKTGDVLVIEDGAKLHFNSPDPEGAKIFYVAMRGPM